ncbi:hypothetical protein EYD45_02275 [Hyunsoonleella flava]|uniref:Uncharacterized protein n=1 Tax=Hyunsoonleella flava TaxID=2527939 RepID=A0A4Q9FLV8_9FLAO|nr:hypothetical protein [Hyunsoonleella flava]TBN06730.1 hypothetical protein EYD45_02275 [Hyunsoonleella flava]
MRHIFLLLLLSFTSLAFAQYPDTTYESPEIRKEAKQIVQTYDAQLGLDGAQEPIFLDKIEDYLVLTHNAKKNLDGKEELDALTSLMAKQSLDMQDILTRPQFQLYKKIWQDIQPIKIITDESK